MTPDSRMIYPLLKGSLEMWYTFGTTPEPHLLAEVIPAFPTDGTLATRNPDLQGHPIADFEAIDLWANANNYA